MSDIIDINVSKIVEEVTINVVDNVIQVNINNVTGGGGGTQTLAQTLDLGNTTGGENISISNGDAIILDNGSMLKKGTIDAGNGGSKGISQICGVGFEHKWEAGRLYIMNDGGTIIREVSHNLTYTPTVNDDVTKGFVQNTRWILDNGDLYVCSDPTEGAAVWVLQINAVPTLQEVTDKGNETTIPIIVKQTENETTTTLTSVSLNFEDIVNEGTTNLVFESSSIPNQQVLIKNETGTVALLSDITIPTLQQVTDEGNETTNSIKAYQLVTQTNGAAKKMTLSSTNVNTERTAEWQDKDYNGIADISDIPTNTSDLTNDGADGINPYITALDIPTIGGSSISYYLNGGTAASVATYYQMSEIAVVGTGVDFSKAGNGLISQWLTDVADPNRLEITAGNWNFEMYMSASSLGGTPAFYVELLKYDGTTFTTISNSSAVPEAITGGTTIDLYLTSLSIPQTTLLVTDRLAIRVYIVNSTGGRTITMHTQDSHLCQIITNFAGGVTSLNGLTTNIQYFDEGTTGTDFNISSTTDTHTFNLPTASATNRGALSTTDWSTFNNKQNALGFTSENIANKENTTLDTSTSKYPTNRLVKEYSDAKVADSITDGVTTIAPSQNAVFDALALKQAALSYTPYKFIQTGITAHTGTVAETIIATTTIAGGSFNASDVMKVMFGANKSSTATACTQRIKINTSNTLTGAVTLAGLNSTTANAIILKRNFVLNNGNLYGMQFSLTNTVTDEAVVLTSTYNNTPFNTANTLYLFFTVQLGNVADSVIPNLFNITN